MIDDFRESGASESRVGDARLTLQRDLESELQQNGYLLNEITAAYSNGEDVAGVFAPRGVDGLTAATIRDAARKYLNKSRYVEVTLSPEKKVAVGPYK